MAVETELSGCYSKIEMRQLNYYSDSWELKIIFGLIKCNRYGQPPSMPN